MSDSLTESDWTSRERDNNKQLLKVLADKKVDGGQFSES